MGSVEDISIASNCGLFNIFWSAKAIDFGILEFDIGSLLGDWCRFVPIRQDLVGDVSKITHVGFEYREDQTCIG